MVSLKVCSDVFQLVQSGYNVDQWKLLHRCIWRHLSALCDVFGWVESGHVGQWRVVYFFRYLVKYFSSLNKDIMWVNESCCTGVFGGIWWHLVVYLVELNQDMWVNGSCWEREKLTGKFALDRDPARIVKETYLYWNSSFTFSITNFLYQDMAEIVMDIFLLYIPSFCSKKQLLDQDPARIAKETLPLVEKIVASGRAR